MSTLITFLNDDSNLSTLKENIATALLDNVNVLLSNTTAYSPTGITSTTLVMAGYGKTFTPTRTGRVLIVMLCTLNNNTVGDGSAIQVNYGTGAPPAAGAAATGTQASALITVKWDAATLTSGGTTGTKQVVLVGIVTGLVLGTAYWLDAAYESVTGGTTTLTINAAYVVEF